MIAAYFIINLNSYSIQHHSQQQASFILHPSNHLISYSMQPFFSFMLILSLLLFFWCRHGLTSWHGFLFLLWRTWIWNFTLNNKPRLLYRLIINIGKFFHPENASRKSVILYWSWCNVVQQLVPIPYEKKEIWMEISRVTWLDSYQQAQDELQ